ncbi:hypothetical protein Pfo_024682 [Paulownia fortunei]|nr:hypothetical protein Pfo_024682 [Paulownia fortunei]
MLPPTPLSLLCAILLCLPLAVIFTFTAPSSTTSPLPITTSSTNNSSKTPNKNQTTANTTIPPPPPSQLAEDDDESLFKLASRVDPSPKPLKKLAFMFLTTSPLPFAPLWELLFARAPKNLYNIYVHADPSVNCTTAFHGVFARRVISSKPTRRHTPTLISAARRLLAHALLHDESNSMFALLSPSCIPIHSFNYTYRTLIKSRRSFIEILKDEPGAYDRWAARGEEAMVPEVEYEDFRIGSQFWVVKRKHARDIVRDRRLWSKFKLPCLRDATCYPEEHYFPTLLNMMDPRGCIPCTLTHVDWKGSHGGHPRMYNASEVCPELIWTLRKTRPRYGGERSQRDGSNSSVRRRHDPFLFARKFSPGSLRRLISIADDVIFKD